MARRGSGFTLVEAMVTLVVLAVLVAAGIPSLRALREQQASLAAFHSLTYSLMAARMAAIQRGRPVSVCPSRDGMRCREDRAWDEGWLVFADPGRGTQPARPEDILWVERRSQGIVAIRATLGRHRVRYQPSGFSGGSNASLRLCTRDGRYLGSVVVNQGGRARSERVPADSGAPCPFQP